MLGGRQGETRDLLRLLDYLRKQGAKSLELAVGQADQTERIENSGSLPRDTDMSAYETIMIVLPAIGLLLTAAELNNK